MEVNKMENADDAEGTEGVIIKRDKTKYN